MRLFLNCVLVSMIAVVMGQKNITCLGWQDRKAQNFSKDTYCGSTISYDISQHVIDTQDERHIS